MEEVKDSSGQQSASRKRWYRVEDKPMGQSRSYVDVSEDSDDEIVLTPAGKRSASILRSLRHMYAAHKEGRLKNWSRMPSPVPSREVVAPPPLTDQEACVLRYVISEPPPDNIEDQCLVVFGRKEQSVRNLISSMHSKISLSLNLLVSTGSSPPEYYVVVKGHFTDDAEWDIHRPILNVLPLPLHSNIVQVLQKCVSNWDLTHKLFSLTFDDALFSFHTSHQMYTSTGLEIPPRMSMGCYSRVITGLALHALGFMKETIMKVRQSIRYVLSSQSRHEMFLDMKQRVGIRSKRELVLDEEAKWDTTYHMLVAAFKMKNAFASLGSYDLDYKMVIYDEEWKQVETLITYMDHFFHAAKLVKASANAYFPILAKIGAVLMRGSICDGSFTGLLNTQLFHKFGTFWESSCNLLAIAYVLDPTVKLATLLQDFRQIYDDKRAEERVESVRYEIRKLWLEYGGVDTIKIETPTTSHEDQTLIPLDPVLAADPFERMIVEWKRSQEARERKFAELSELDQYLEDVVYETRGRKGFDVLVWWKQNKAKYPTLSRMACDVLALPVSTLDSDSAFDTTAVKTIHSSLSPSSLEAVICANDWLK